ncbi:FAD-dependent monooxygenase [Aquabacterium sp. A7-Y]|uniref:FAD-dependent monooxygenase n=1 Tax=Aquabacterium sp. A7-Y TaxID=1349605 RepID=UPI00223D78A7|nr:FAD-dependent monooxygenase [Aquabacterium sp. A7-Y]MCW7538821.1 FAD-dependent monooxygenase [Aquabacterium sp. A7-Y]
MLKRNQNRALRVVVIGAGIGGLAAAAALRQRGHEVVVCERAAQLGEVGAGLQVGPNAVKVIRALGLEDAFMAVAAEPTERVSLDWNDGSERYREPFMHQMSKLYGARYLMAHRADLHKLLLGLLPESALSTGRICIGVENTAEGAVARFADGRQIEADVVLGADGIHSVVRGTLFGSGAARFTDQICWRVIIPMDDFLSVAPRLKVPLSGSEYTGWIGPTGHVLFYPLRGGQLLNIFAGRVSRDWAEESWAVGSDVGELLDAYAGWNDGMLAVLAKAKETSKWGIHDRDPLPHWVQGRIALLGDAAHPMMPTLAQGAAISLEDGYAVARHLDQGRADPGAALAAYERERQPRASKVQLQARQQFLNNQRVPAPPPLPVDWIYGHDAVTGREHVAA